MFSKNKSKEIDNKTADAILQNILKECNADADAISLEEIKIKQKRDYKSDTLLVITVAILLFATILLPQLFTPASAFVSVDSGSARTLTVSEHRLTEDSFSLTLVGPVIDISKTYAETVDGEIIEASNYYRNDNKIVFPNFSKEANIFIYDVNGNCLHLLFSPH